MSQIRLSAIYVVVFLGITAVIASPAEAANEGIVGNWARGDGNARVRIAPCGNALCAINTWIKDTSGGEHVGDKLVMKVAGGGASLSGTAYDPQRRLNYNLEIDVSSQTMHTRGCVLAGIVCKTISWTRVSH
jgi:uncharacterized protein (DUF2147 family)